MELTKMIPKYVLEVINTLENSGYKSYLVGGCVRDLLLKKQPKDYDINLAKLKAELFWMKPLK